MFSSSAKYLNCVLPVALCAVLGLAIVTAAAQQRSSATSAPAPQADDYGVKTAPVVMDGTTLFYVRGVSAFPAVKRAQQVAESIQALAADRAFSIESLALRETPDGTQILAANQSLMTVFDADARLEGVERQVLAKAYLTRIGEAINAYRHDRESRVLAQHALDTFLATVALLLGLWVTYRFIKWSRSSLKKRYEKKVQELESRSFYLVHAEHLWRLLNGVLGFLGTVIALMAVYFYLRCVLSLFPWTRGLANSLIAILVDPLRTMGSGLLLEVPDLMFLTILILITRYLLRLIRAFFAAVESEKFTLTGFDAAWAKPTYRLVRIAVIALAVVIGYPYVPGSGSAVFKGVSVFIGLIFSLGSTSFVGNVIAGYSLTYRRILQVGDRVKIGDHIGDVEEMRLMVTHVRTPKNEVVVVSNSSIINGEVVNYSKLAQNDGLILHTTVDIGYETPWRQVEAMLVEAAARTRGLLREPQPFVLQKQLGDFAVNYEINAYCHDPRAMYDLYSALHHNILDVFNEYGVQIMTPAYERDPERAKIVPRNQWYAAPARPAEIQPEPGGHPTLDTK